MDGVGREGVRQRDSGLHLQQADSKITLHGHGVAVMQVQNDIRSIMSAVVQQCQKEEAEEMIARSQYGWCGKGGGGRDW